MSDPRPIGVFDSGLGGLTVVRALRQALPQESILYLGDTARVPYGNKSATAVQSYSRQISEYLVGYDAKMIIVACNTASALALDVLQTEWSLPVVGVIEPGVETALAATENNHIGIIGTIATIRSGAYQAQLQLRRANLLLRATPCPLFVPLVEEGWLDGPIVEAVAEKYLADINASSVDTLILGCTHYPLLKPVLQQVVKPGTTLVDSATAIVGKIAEILKTRHLSADDGETGSFTCMVTDLPAQFETIAGRFLGTAAPQVEHVRL
ncbi:MAG: glutamate racemase [Fidelibacterota bacterium]